MNILFYTVSNKRSRDIESQAIHFAAAGHTIHLLTQSPESELHHFFAGKGFRATAVVERPGVYTLVLLRQLRTLLGYCSQFKIDIVHSHLDPCNQISVVASYLSRTRFVVTRHHADALEYEASSAGRRLSRWIYRLASEVIVVSENVKEYMVREERIAAGKITVVPLSYDFSLYGLPPSSQVAECRLTLHTARVIVAVGRLSSLKRTDEIIRVLSEVRSHKIDVGLIIVGAGPEERRLRQLVVDLQLSEVVHFTGFTDNPLSWLAAADVCIHLSRTEASCTVVKEAALVGVPAIVCEGAGDFASYIRHGVNGWLVPVDNPVRPSVELLVRVLGDQQNLRTVGERLRQAVLSHFDIRNVLPLYERIHSAPK